MEDRIGKALSKLRVVMRSSGWTQVEVAEKIGVTQKTFSFWMHKKSRPFLNKVLVIEELCNKYEQGKEKGKEGKESNDLKHRFKHGIVSVHWGGEIYEGR